MGQGQPIRGVRDQDIVPACALRTSDGRIVEAPSLRVSLDVASLGLSNRYGRSWMERVAALRDRHGPFALAWLETIVRTADVRASRSAREDQTPVAPRTLT
jgi:CRISPR-associated endonuclease/helicase Cas3